VKNLSWIAMLLIIAVAVALAHSLADLSTLLAVRRLPDALVDDKSPERQLIPWAA
jgi:hypothetical protein